MKYIIFSVTLLFSVFSCNNTFKENPTEYNNRFVQIQFKIVDRLTALATSFATCDSTEMFAHLNEFKITTDSCINVVEGMKDYEGNTGLKDAALDFLKFNKKISENECLQMINILKTKSFSANDKKMIDEIRKEIYNNEKPIDKAFKDAQNNFAKKYDLKVGKRK